jgi:organic hydroperoxide reductase OsmC/OhrA
MSVKIEYKPSYFKTNLTWQEERKAAVSAEGKPSIQVASPARKYAQRWTPEHFFVASVDICLMIIFTSLAEKQGISLLDYQSEAEGTFERKNEIYQFTKIAVRPRVTISDEKDKGRALKAIEDAEKRCPLAESAKAEIIVEPTILVKK